MSYTWEFYVVPNAWRFGDNVPAATDWRTLGNMQAGRLDSGSEVIWHGDVRLQTFKPYRQVAIFEDLELWRSPSNTQLLLYKAPKLTLVLNAEMVTGTRILLLNLSNMAGNSVMQLDFPWTVKLTRKYLRKQALVSLRVRSILRCSQELNWSGRKAWRNSRPAGDPEARQREQVVQGPQEATAHQNGHPQVLCQFVRADRQCRNREKKDAVHRLLAASWSEPVNMFVCDMCMFKCFPACMRQAGSQLQSTVINSLIALQGFCSRAEEWLPQQWMLSWLM